jgi:hypothetical protein
MHTKLCNKRNWVSFNITTLLPDDSLPKLGNSCQIWGSYSNVAETRVNLEPYAVLLIDRYICSGWSQNLQLQGQQFQELDCLTVKVESRKGRLTTYLPVDIPRRFEFLSKLCENQYLQSVHFKAEPALDYTNPFIEGALTFYIIQSDFIHCGTARHRADDIVAA